MSRPPGLVDHPGRSRGFPHVEDLQLVRATLGRDAAARRRFGARMLYLARCLAVKNARSGAPLSDDELADVVQDSLTILWSKRRSYEGRAALETWAYRIGVLEWMNALRRKRRLGETREIQAMDGSTGDVDQGSGLAADDAVFVLEALENLGSPDCAVIRMKHFQDASFGEIGATMDESTNTVKYWYYRGMKKLRARVLPRMKEPRT